MAENENRGAPAKGGPDPCLVLLDGEPTDLEYMPPQPRVARVILRTMANDDGHFTGLEVVA